MLKPIRVCTTVTMNILMFVNLQTSIKMLTNQLINEKCPEQFHKD